MSIEEYGEHTRQHIAELQASLDDVYVAPEVETYSIWDGVADVVDFAGDLLTVGEVLLGALHQRYRRRS